MKSASDALPRGREASSSPYQAEDGPAAPGGAVGGAIGWVPVGGPPSEIATRSSQASRRALKNWRVRSRLFLLVLIPTLTAVAAGGIFIASSVQSAIVNQRTLTLANLSNGITGLVQALQNEREDTVTFIVLGTTDGRGASSKGPTPPGPELALLSQAYVASNTWADQVKALAGGIGGSYSALAQQDTKAALTAIGDLPAIRAAATGTQLPVTIVIDEYATAISSLLSVQNQISVGSSDSTLAGAVRVLGLVSSMKEEVSQQQALLTSALGPDLISLGTFGPTQQADLTDEQAQQQGNFNEFETAATTAQLGVYNSALTSAADEQALAQEQQAISIASSGSRIATDPTVSDASSQLTVVVNSLRSVEQQFAASVTSQAGSLHDNAITEVILFGLAVVLLLAIALALTLLVGRSMVGPLRRLRNGALEVAEIRLPETVSRMSEADAADVALNIEPIDVDSLDEIGEVARAFDQVHKEAIRLAANEAALRGNVNAMFINLSRRIQSLVERQIRVITTLEQSEQDSERLANLFQIDHLATRMRRNSENLLVLAGQEFARRFGQPVALVDVIRAAVSEIEQYKRVTPTVEPGISIRRDAVRDVVHLVAELVENATSFSNTETPVTIEAYSLESGGMLIDITDQGVGMRPEAMAQANHRLDNPPAVDVEVSRRMGLFVVAQLAARHGIRIRLRAAASSGLSALVWLPPEAIAQPAGNAGPQRPGGQVAPEAGQVAGNGRRSIAPVSERQSEHLDMADTAVIRRRMRAGGLGTAAGRPDPEPEHRGGHRTETFSAPSGVGSYSPPNGIPIPASTISVPPPGSIPVPSPTSSPVSVPNGGLPRRAGSTLTSEVPGAQADSHTVRERLPIYEAVETVWFRGGRQVMGEPRQEADWSSPADEGWRAAKVANEPTSDGTTQSGLPKRAPGTNLVPGTAAASSAAPAGKPVPPPVASRSAAENRNRFASYQRGIQRGRAAAVGANPNSEGDMA